ncbi:transposase [Sorangium sp. So ce1128]
MAGFNIHAGVRLRAGDRAGLERLCRYGARPPFSLERIWLLPDGRVEYRLRKPRRNGATHLVLAPVHFERRPRSWAFSSHAHPRSPARVGGPRGSAFRDPAGSS